jgi:hypothetical protein
VVEEQFAVGCGGERRSGLEDADAGGAFDVLAVSHEDDLVEAEGGGCRALGGVAAHVQDLAEVFDSSAAGAGGDDGGWRQVPGGPGRERVGGWGGVPERDAVFVGIVPQGVW